MQANHRDARDGPDLFRSSSDYGTSWFDCHLKLAVAGSRSERANRCVRHATNMYINHKCPIELMGPSEHHRENARNGRARALVDPSHPSSLFTAITRVRGGGGDNLCK